MESTVAKEALHDPSSSMTREQDYSDAQQVDEAIVKNRLFLNNRLQKRFFSKILNYRSSKSEDDLQQIFLDILQTQFAIMKSDYQSKMNEQELFICKAEQETINAEMNVLSAQINVLKSQLIKAYKQLLFRTEYKPLIEKLKILPPLVDSETSLVVLEEQIEELNLSKERLEAAKISCKKHISLAALSMSLAKDAVYLEKIQTNLVSTDDVTSPNSSSISLMEIG